MFKSSPEYFLFNLALLSWISVEFCETKAHVTSQNLKIS